MKITQSEHQQVNEFITENPGLFADWQITDKTTSNLFSAAILLEIVVTFCENIHKLDEGATTIGKLLTYVKKLLCLRKTKEGLAELTTRERVTMIMFDTYVKTRKGMDVEKLANYTGIKTEELDSILKDLSDKHVVRKTVTGNWIYKN